MKLLQKIRESLQQYRVMRDEGCANALRTLIGEIERDAQRRTDDDFVVSVIRKSVKNNNDYLAIPGLDAANRSVLTAENALLSSLLPAAMTDEQVDTVIAKYNSEGHTGRNVRVFVQMLQLFAQENEVIVDNASAIARFKSAE